MVFGGLIGGEKPTAAQRQLLDLVCNDGVHALSSFDMNQMASLTYGDLVCDELFDALQEIMSKPMDYSVLTVQKSLVVAKHVMIYGSDHTLHQAIALKSYVERLQEFNTVLWSQQRPQGAAAFLYKLKGGGVDQGLPVRQAAQELHAFLTMSPPQQHQVRNDRADPNSLVPVGDQKTVFLSNDARHYLLKKRIEQQYQIQTKSNLAMASGGFGGGYNSRDGTTVVGAAHGLDEMIKIAQQSNNRFTDHGDHPHATNTMDYIPDLMQLPEYNAAAISARKQTKATKKQNKNHSTAAAVAGDLLDFSNDTATVPVAEANLLGGGADLLGAAAPQQHIDIFAAPTTTTTMAAGGLLDLHVMGGTTATTAPTVANHPLHDLHDAFANITLSATTTTNNNTTAVDPFAPPLALSNNIGMAGPPPLPSEDPPTSTISLNSNVMGSAGHDRFAALDALEVPMTTAGSMLSAKEAEQRLLSATANNSAAAVGNGMSHHPYGSADPLTGGIMEPTNNQLTTSLELHNNAGGGASFSNLSSLDTNGLGGHSSISSTAGGGGLKIAQTISTWGGGTDNHTDDDDDEDGFVMGGTVGAGLEPTTAAPAAPPPPPPPPC